jgi:hypothetical protein
VLQDDLVSGVDGHPVHGPQFVVGERPRDEPGPEAYSLVEPLRSDPAYFPDVVLLASVPANAVHSQVEAWLPGRSLDEAYSPDVVYPPTSKHSEDEAHHCAQLECYDRRYQVEERCSQNEGLAYSATASLLPDWRQALQPLWPAPRRGR